MFKKSSKSSSCAFTQRPSLRLLRHLQQVFIYSLLYDSFLTPPSAHLLADPTSFEEPLLNANIYIVVGSNISSSTSASTPPAPSTPMSKLQMRAKEKTQSQAAASEPQKEFALVSVSQTGPSMLEGPNGLRDSLELCVPLALAQRAELEDILEDALSDS